MPIPDASLQNPYGQAVTFKVSDVLPPSAVYIGPDDQIFVQFLIPTISGCQATITWRFLRASDGELVIANDTFQIVGPVFPFRFFIPPSEGWLLSLMVQTNNVSRGQVWTRAFINRGNLNVVTNLVALLVQGYTGVLDTLVYPGTVFESSLNGRGFLKDVLVSAGLGLNAVFTVPANVHWLVRAASFSLSTDAVVQNRTALVKVNDPTATTTLTVAAPGVVAANSSATFAFASGNAVVTNGQFQSTGLPDQLILPPAWAITFGAFNLDPGDQIGGAVLTVEEFVGQ